MSNVSWRIPALRPQSHARPARASQCLCGISGRQRNIALNPSRAALFAQRPRCIVARRLLRFSRAFLRSLFCCAELSTDYAAFSIHSPFTSFRFHANSRFFPQPRCHPRLPHTCACSPGVYPLALRSLLRPVPLAPSPAAILPHVSTQSVLLRRVIHRLRRVSHILSFPVPHFHANLRSIPSSSPPAAIFSHTSTPPYPQIAPRCRTFLRIFAFHMP